MSKKTFLPISCLVALLAISVCPTSSTLKNKLTTPLIHAAQYTTPPSGYEANSTGIFSPTACTDDTGSNVSGLYANGTPVVATQGQSSGQINIYVNDSLYTSTYGQSSTSSTNTYFDKATKFENFTSNNANGFNLYCGKKAYSSDGTNTSMNTNSLVNVDTTCTIESGTYNEVFGDYEAIHDGNTTMNVTGGTIKKLAGTMDTMVNSQLTNSTQGNVTINLSGNTTITSLLASNPKNSSWVFPSSASDYKINIKDNVNITYLYLYSVYNHSNTIEKVVNITGKMSDTARVAFFIYLDGSGYSAGDIPEGTNLVCATNTSYLDNYADIFSITQYYTGKKGTIARSGNYLYYTYTISAKAAATPTSSYNNGTISGLSANRRYLLTDSSNNTHYVTSDSNGKIVISSTTNRDLAGLSIRSIVNLRSSSDGSDETADSAAQSVSYSLPTVRATPASSFASNSTISGLTASETYILTDSTGTTHTIKANTSGQIVLDDTTNRELAGLTITSIVLKGNETTTINSEKQTVSYAFKAKESTPASSFATNTITGLSANATYVLTDSKGATHEVTTDSSGKIVIDDTHNASLAGLTITSIYKKAGSNTIKSDPQTVSYTLPSRHATPTSTFTNNTISGLTAGETYVLSYSGGTKEVVADNNGKIILSDTSNRELAGLTITSITQKASGNYLSSLAQTVNDVFGSKEVISNTPTYSGNTFTGLDPSTSYTLTDTNGGKHVVTSTSEGKIVIDDTTNTDLAGLSIASITKNGTGSSISSDPMTFGTPIALPTKVATPTTTYDEDTATISGLIVGQSYLFTFSDGSTYSFTATDTTFKVSDSSNPSLAGKKVTSIVASGNGSNLLSSDAQNVDDQLAKKEVLSPLTLTYDPSQDTISGLATKTNYRLYYQGGYLDVTSDENGKCDLSKYSELIGKTITSIAKPGTKTTITSDAQTVDNFSVKKREETPASVTEGTDGVLGGLKPNTTYVLKDSKGNSYTATSDKDGKISTYDIVDDKGVKVASKTTFVSIEAKGNEDTPSINSKVKTFTESIVVPTREVIGDITFDPTYGVISGFDPNEDYELTYTDSSGNIKKETITTDESGKISLLEHDELTNSKITNITKLGITSKDTIASQDKATDIKTSTKDSYGSATKSKEKTDLEELVASLISSSDVTDKDKVTDKVASIISEALKSIDKLPNDGDLTSEIKKIVDSAKAQSEFEIKRQKAIETVEALGRSCGDTSKVDEAVTEAVTKLNNLTYSSTSSSEVDTLVSQTTTKVNLIVKQTELTDEVGTSCGDNPSTDEQALIDEYTTKINNATTEEEATTFYNDFIKAKDTLRNQAVEAKQQGLMIACFVIFGVYLLFYIIYGLIFKHYTYDGIHVITMTLDGIFLIIMSCLIKAMPGFVALGLSWFVLVLAIGLTTYFTIRASKDSNQEDGETKNASGK